MQTITRKFLVKHIPDLTGNKHWIQNRFYLYRKNGIVIRVQSNGKEFELERKVTETDLIRESKKIMISKEEYEAIGKNATEHVTRDNYMMSETPRTILRIYHGQFEGLVRAEIEFKSVEQAKQFIPLSWMEAEITATLLAKDETLLDLTRIDFQKLLSLKN
ncbi:hypothetical protein HY947_03290 [Candidatus Gottesmanbacteria bacterium]|nr:hypothetical protein [Candidatus Gottesmanbacteria bacterium]